MKPLKIAIVGTAPSSAGLAPYHDDEWQIWGCSTAPDKLPSWDQWFELHDLKRKRAVHPKYYDYMAAEDKRPIWLHQSDPKIPMGRPFPRGEVIERFGPMFTNTPDDFAYLTNTISWMMAYAALEIERNEMQGEVGIWGVDMAVGDASGNMKSEYRWQRPSCEWFMGYLTAFLGKPVTLPAESDLCTAEDMYGFDTDNSPRYMAARARKIEQLARRDEVRANLTQTQETALRMEGGMIELETLGKLCGDKLNGELQQRQQAVSGHLEQARRAIAELQAGVHALDGSLTNIEWFEQGCPPGGTL